MIVPSFGNQNPKSNNEQFGVMKAVTPETLNEIEARAKRVNVLMMDSRTISGTQVGALLADVLALVARVRELESALEFEMGNSSSETERERAEKAEARVKEQQQRGEEICCAYGDMLMRVGSLFRAIEHGDDAHRAWLRAEIEKHFNMEAHNLAATALTERLKAAEAVCEAAGDFNGSFRTWSALDGALAAWRKVKGEPLPVHQPKTTDRCPDCGAYVGPKQGG